MNGFSDGKAIAAGIARELSGPLGNRIREIAFQDSPFLDIMPEDQVRECAELVLQGYAAGLRADSITEQVSQFCPSLDEETVTLHVRAQVNLSGFARIQAKAENRGQPLYVWKSVRDERSSPDHIAMHGVVCRWEEKPAPDYGRKPFHPGCAIGCRCRAQPVLDLEDIQYPARVWVSGKIVEIPDEYTLCKTLSL